MKCIQFFLIMLPMMPIVSYGESKTYTWDDCVKLTYQNNAELSGADANIKASQFQKKALRSGFMPKVSADLGWAEQKLERRSSNFFNSNNNNNGQSYSASLNASVNLFSGLRDYSRLNQAEASIEAANAKFITVKSRVSYELKAAFENYLYAKAYQKLTEQIIKRRTENLNIVELRFDNGQENKGSVLLSAANLAQAKYEALLARNAQVNARSQLAKVMGLDEFGEFDVTGEVPLYGPPVSAPSFDELARSTPEYLEARAQEVSAEKGIELAKGSFYPSLDLSGGVRKLGEDYFPEDSKQTTVGLTLTIPIFDGGKDYYGTKSAVQGHVASKSNRLNVSRGLVATLQQKYSSFIESVSKLEADKLYEKATEVRATIGRSKYNNGLLTFENWDIIESDLITRQKNFLQSKLNRVLSQASWDQALGKGIEL